MPIKIPLPHSFQSLSPAKRAGAVILLLCAASGFLFFVFHGQRPGNQAPAILLEKGSMVYTIEADGLIESAHRAEVYAPSSLRAAQIYVKESVSVRKGDTLAKLDTEALTLDIQRAELNIKSAESNMTSEQRALVNSVTGARNALSSADVSMQTAQREYDALLAQQGSEAAISVAAIDLDSAKRAHEYNLALYSILSISREMLTQSENTLHKAQTAYDDAVRSARDALDIARETLEAAKIRQKTAKDTLDDAVAQNTDPAAIALELQKVAYNEKLLRLRDATIQAPADGVVTLVNAKEGAPASGLMFVIEDEGHLILSARVEEADVPEIREGMRCLIRPAGRELVLEGVVTRLPFSAERDVTGAYTAVVGDDAYFVVEASIEEVQPGVLIGMNAKASFIVGEKESCYVVPSGLICRDGERRWVLTRTKAGRLEEIPVQIGLETRRQTEIIADALYEGMALYSSID